MATRKRGKIIAKWEFTVNRVAVVVPVRMYIPEYTDQETEFIVDYTHGEHDFKKTSSDIDALRRETKAWLKDVITFKYETYFHIIFHGAVEKPQHHESHLFSDTTIQDMNDSEVGEVDTHMEWRKYQSGTTAAGQPMYRDCSKLLNNGNWTEGELETGLKKRDIFFNYHNSMTALILATPENEAGLMQLADAFETLHDKLMKFLTPEMIEHNFAKMIGAMPLLGVDP